jgi:hypothetical protein
MAALSFPIDPAGLLADVAVNLEASVLLPLRSSGGGSAPIQGRALIDTGSDITAVALPILQQLRIPPILQTVTQGIGGAHSVNLYRVSLHVLDARNVNLPWLSQPSLVVMDLPGSFPFDVLIGMDVLLTCKMVVEGPGRMFTLEF